MLSSLWKRPGRSALTVTAIMISTALLISMLSITEGMRSRNMSSLESSDQDIVMTAMGYRGGIINSHAMAASLEEDDTNISFASPILVTSVSLHHRDKWYPLIAIGIIPERIEPFLSEDGTVELIGLEMSFEDWFETGDDPFFDDNYNGTFTGELLVTDFLSESIEVGTGGNVVLGQSGSEERNFTQSGTFSTPLTGEGIFGMVIQGIVIMHLSELQHLVGAGIHPESGEIEDRASSIIISMRDDKKTSGDVERFSGTLKERYPLFMVLTKSDRLDLVEERSNIADIFYTSAGSVSLVIGLLFVACVMIISIYERQSVIGIMRAIGISKRTIFRSIFMESIVLILTGASLGVLPGYLGSELIGNYMSYKYGLEIDFTYFTAGLVFKCLAYVLVIGCVFALFPAFKASRIQVIDAMNDR